MTKTSIRFSADDELHKVIILFNELNLEAGLVFKENELIGIITERDLLKGIALKRKTIAEIVRQVEKTVQEDEIIAMIDAFDCTVYPVRNQDNIWTGYVTKTQLLDAKNHQAETEALSLNAIFEFAHNGIIAIDNKGYVTAMNPAAEKLTNLKKENVIGHFLHDVGIPTGLLDVVRTGKKRTDKYHVGKRKYISNRTPIYKRGEVIGAVGVFQDISDIEKISNELKTVHQLVKEYDYIMKNSSDAIAVLDKLGAIEKTNQAFQLMIGTDALPDYYQQLVDVYVENCVVTAIEQEQKPVTFVEKNKKTGKLMLVRAVPLQFDGRYEKIIVSILDTSNDIRNHHSIYFTNRELHELFSDFEKAHTFVSQSSTMKKLKKQIVAAGSHQLPVLIEGERGTGKERMARMIHSYSVYKQKKFKKIDCAAFSNRDLKLDDDLEGTLFLSEVGKLSKEAQSTFIHFMNKKRNKVRFIVTSSEDLERLVMTKQFQKELYDGLRGDVISVPPLRERKEDIPLMISVFQDKFSDIYNVERFFTKEAIEFLTNYHWPGNLTELMYVVERVILTTSESIITKKHIENALFKKDTSHSNDKITINEMMPLKAAIEEVEKQLIMKSMNIYQNTRNTAAALGVNQSTIVRKMQKFSND